MSFGVSAHASVAHLSGETAGAVALAKGGAKLAGNAEASAGSKKQQAEMLKLKKAATQFEAMLLEKWWSSMKQSGLSEDDSSDPGQGTLDNMGMQAMSTAVAGAGGIGIASMLVHSLQGEIAAESANAAPVASVASALAVSNKSN
ncbi:MAG: hypothetical protein ACRD5K_01090 [Candidatus Acidiferrales bacterium]